MADRVGGSPHLLKLHWRLRPSSHHITLFFLSFLSFFFLGLLQPPIATNTQWIPPCRQRIDIYPFIGKQCGGDFLDLRLSFLFFFFPQRQTPPPLSALYLQISRIGKADADTFNEPAKNCRIENDSEKVPLGLSLSSPVRIGFSVPCFRAVNRGFREEPQLLVFFDCQCRRTAGPGHCRMYRPN